MQVKPGPCELESTYLRLGTDSSIELLPVDENFWPDIMAGKLGYFRNEYLVTSFEFDEDWPSWEQHPNGDELVFLISGAADLILDQDGQESVVELRESGSFVIVPKAAWHTAKIKGPTRMLFVTAGEGTVNRPIAT